MALLRRLRHPGGGRRLSFRLRPLRGLLILGLLAGAGCRKADDSLRPEQLLRDSLGLGDDDRVHVVRLSSPDNVERVEPASVQIRPGDHVEFRTTDGRVHAVTFLLDSLPAPAADFLRASAQESSPPLVEAESRFLVTFADAPVGRYPFVVVGNGTEGRGEIVVAEPSR